ncbi:Thymidylate kinase [Paraburkholderia ultramafica]|uniref:Thymidylate kinase n=1 Tax=Paraburkholderia ultramafica TaxID=1544867 RepID=A0A6S7BE60_9BURK|nr:thymidylate kinase [Paraburkholderia ultramafica]CAB3785929.1 Thymidylate kinase [Paraburkholderia ultramafica]
MIEQEIRVGQPLFISFDGPKGTGKTTILEGVRDELRALGREVVALCEKELDPYRADTIVLLEQLSTASSPALETRICQQLAAGRAWITTHILEALDSGKIALIDRWYPSDAAFRRSIPFEQVLDINRTSAVRDPDIAVAVTCAAPLSWDRAWSRSRGLNSHVIQSFEQHKKCTEVFNDAVEKYGWYACINDRTVSAAVAAVVSRVQAERG